MAAAVTPGGGTLRTLPGRTVLRMRHRVTPSRRACRNSESVAVGSRTSAIWRTQSATIRRRVSSWEALALASELGAACAGASLERASPSVEGLRLGEGGVHREPCQGSVLRVWEAVVALACWVLGCTGRLRDSTAE